MARFFIPFFFFFIFFFFYYFYFPIRSYYHLIYENIELYEKREQFVSQILHKSFNLPTEIIHIVYEFVHPIKKLKYLKKFIRKFRPHSLINNSVFSALIGNNIQIYKLLWTKEQSMNTDFVKHYNTSYQLEPFTRAGAIFLELKVDKFVKCSFIIIIIFFFFFL